MKKDRKKNKLSFEKFQISKLNNSRTIKGGFAALLDDDDSGQNTQLTQQLC
ncbi:hypothetical protein J8L88_10780 [Aquimarina sp. MMG015]|uniref:hypothetical protein n=1 Tax=Aquimarina sp. MMG015 TaxID=2822689 RepID=UPI001B3A3A51|nr:hypothetical protein [Aquimarina sp. MMG015]MBQ4803332.1 hypothetical protein [Aquimarina sp. MMG015]